MWLPEELAGAAAIAALALLAAGCTGSGPGTSGAGTSHASPAAAAKPTASATAPVPRVAITPGNGATGVEPSAGITVTATRGTLTNVTVRTAGDPVSGQLSQDRRSGTASGPWTYRRPTR